MIWPAELIQALGRRRCVIVIGSGVSRNSVNNEGKRPASWEEFLLQCADQLNNPPYISSLIAQKDYLTACELIKNELTSDRFIDLVQMEYQRAAYEPADIHRYIYDLDASIVISPNFDTIYDTHAMTVSQGAIVIKDHISSDIANYLMGGEFRLLIKTHGSANSPQNVIFTRRDYAEARTKHNLFYEILKALVLTHTFFFIGCGVDDPDIRLLFEDVQFAHGRRPFHYMTVPEGEVDEKVLQIISDSMRIKFLKYSPGGGHAELTTSLRELVLKVDLIREEIGKNLTW